ncbi:YhcH/YjgK/YiaL family protein [Paenibacillus sp. LHD-38]|uniref:YhcH/YjgK/YiaL family protein n=1 Tax=Paenibacillus sp. LHD-38 TaxID=3072143 RepID=UPI00280EE8D9|nr:YhcH/YjgK/YiaL family protein [Paenibacillus sp. LHD-38]MDQ8738475.1 YhcH/YjgK/YiaL family protein [Paenibacillus sp. LHD-38]
MIVGSLRHWTTQRESAHPVLRKAIDYLAETDFEGLEEGKHPIQGDDMFALLMAITTKPKEEQPAEKHERFLDIHLLLQGEETIGWQLHSENSEPTEPYNQEQDFALFVELKDETLIQLKPGMYMVLFPDDIHRPGLATAHASNVRKVVVKINQDLL